MASTSVNARPRRTGKPRSVRPGGSSGRCGTSGSMRPARRRIASNFAFLSIAELICRTTSVLVTL